MSLKRGRYAARLTQKGQDFARPLRSRSQKSRPLRSQLVRKRLCTIKAILCHKLMVTCTAPLLT